MQQSVRITPAVSAAYARPSDAIDIHRRESCAQRIGVEPVGRDVLRALQLVVRAQRIDGVGSDDQQYRRRAIRLRSLAVDRQRPSASR